MKESELDELVEQLVRARGAFTQREVGQALGLSARAVQDWELRVDRPTLLHLIGWARFLGFRMVLDIVSWPRRPRPPRKQTAPPQVRESVVEREYDRLAAQLRQTRESFGLNQAALGAMLGVSRDSLIRWERGSHPPMAPQFLAWVRALGLRIRLVRISDLVGA